MKNFKQRHSFLSIQRFLFLLTTVLMCSGQMWATDYVFKSNGYYLGIDESGNLTHTTTFSTNCIWTAWDGSNVSSLPTSYSSSVYLFAVNSSGTKYYLNANGQDCNTSTTASDKFWLSGTELRYGSSVLWSSYKLSWYNNEEWSWRTSRGVAASYAQNSVSETKSASTKYTWTTDLSISPESWEATELNSSKEFTASAVVKKDYNPAYYNATVDGHVYYVKTESLIRTTTNPTETSYPGITYSWNVSNNLKAYTTNTSTNTTSTLTYDKTNTTADITDGSISVTATITGTSVSKTASATVTLRKMPTFYYSAPTAEANVTGTGAVLNVSPATAGSITGTKHDDTSATLKVTYTATLTSVNTNLYKFVGWSENSTGTSILSTAETYEYSAEIDGTNASPTTVKLYAIFKKLSTLELEALPKTGGYVLSSYGATTSTPTANTHSTTVEDVAKPVMYLYAKENGYHFKGWSSTNSYDNYDIGTTQEGQTYTMSSPEYKKIYAMFMPYYTFKAIAAAALSNGTTESVSDDGGTVTATIREQEQSASTVSELTIETTVNSGATAWAYFEATPKEGYKFDRWTLALNNGGAAYVIANAAYSERIQNTVSGSTMYINNSSTPVTLYAVFKSLNNPTAWAVTPSSMELYMTGGTQTGQITVTLTPATAYKNITYTSGNTAIATVDKDGLVTAVAQGQTTITVTSYKQNADGSTEVFQTTTISVTVIDKLPTPTISIVKDNNDPEQATATITAGVGSPDTGVTIYYTTDGSEPTKTNGTAYSSPVVIANGTTIKARAYCDGWQESDVASKSYSRNTVPTPTIIINSDANRTVSFSCTASDVTFYYTIDGTDPQHNDDGTVIGTTEIWNGTPFTPAVENCTIKVLGTHADGWQDSDIAEAPYIGRSGVYGTSVVLNDLEDHTWSYYTGEETTVGGTDQTYKDKYLYTLYSPDPRNVKITYKGVDLEGNLGSNVAVSTTEPENQFVYYKTVEKYNIGFYTDANGNGLPDETVNADEQYAYTVISNPFSKRPKKDNKYYGFAGWKVKSGYNYIKRADGTTCAKNAVLDLDEIIHFINLDKNYTANCISAEIVLEATWTEATIKTGNTAQVFTGGTYETNFIVATSDISSAITQSSPCTITAMYPDGSSDNSATITFNAGLTVGTSTGTVKVEYIRHGDVIFNANGHNLIMGRGITSSSDAQGRVYGRYSNVDCVNTVKVESGNYYRVSNLYTDESESTVKINCYLIYGCDYDRARADYFVAASDIESNEYNTKLRATNLYGANNAGPQLNRDKGSLYIRLLIKSGIFGSSQTTSCYFHSYGNRGHRYIEMEGGYNKGHFKGGSEKTYNQEGYRSMTIRMRNGRIDGQIGLGSTSEPCSGERVIIVTGGRIGGWIAPGSNCSSSGSGTGITDAESYVYFGGTAEINSRQFDTTPGLYSTQSTGGVIYGSGLGISSTASNGEMSRGSNIVLADQAYVERGIYGGGALGQTKKTANIFILGGRVGTGTGTIEDRSTSPTTTYTVDAGVYGGACYVGGDTCYIYMSGGIVESGIYGGSNVTGTMNGNTHITIVGGQVGTSTQAANVYGGGYGNSTKVLGNVDVAIGTKTSGNCGYTTTGTAVINGDVYGGSALGTVNDATSDHTNVMLNSGTIHGSLYGGGLGDASNAAAVNGPVAVKVYGGTINRTKLAGDGRTMGSGSDGYIWGSGGVYGCNNVNGTPASTVTVDIYGTDAVTTTGQYALYSVFGGGNLSAYTGTPKVAVHNCNNSIEYVYGGGNAADVSGTDVTIWGGDVIGNVFGGGNGAADGWPTSIASENPGANVSGKAAVKINGGTLLNVFGGSNEKGTIGDGTIGDWISVTVDQQKESTSCGECRMNVSNIFGAGNNAPYTGNTNVTIINTKCDDGTTGTVGNVFGGGKGTSATVTGNSQVNIGDDVNGHEVTGIGNIYGGGDLAQLTGTTNISIRDCETQITGDIYGGGNKATVGNTNTQIYGVTLKGNVYGGGHGTETIDAQVGTDAGVNGNAVTKIYGGSYSGIFGAGNINSSIKTGVNITLDEVDNYSDCPIEADEIYGAGNEANAGCPVTFTLGCLSGRIKELYGGAKNSDFGTADKAANIALTIHSGSYGRIFGGNNKGGDVYGKIQVTVQHDGCKPIRIDTLFGGGNLADYDTNKIPASAWGTGETKSNNFPEITLLPCDYKNSTYNTEATKTDDWVDNDSTKHCLKIGTIFGGGNGATTGTYAGKGKVIGNPYINVYGGEIGTIFGGGNNADIGDDTHTCGTYITIQDKDANDEKGIYVIENYIGETAAKEKKVVGNGNVYGGGNNAQVWGDTHVQVGPPAN